MKSITSVYNIGPGPSSSHTIAPFRAAQHFLNNVITKKIECTKIKITLYGSLAFTCNGHGTTNIIKSVFSSFETELIIDLISIKEHPNTMLFECVSGNTISFSAEYISVGGGDILCGDNSICLEDKYPHKCLNEINDYVRNNNLSSYVEYVLKFEPDICSYLQEVINEMFKCVESGLVKEGIIIDKPNFKVKRLAHVLYRKAEQATDIFDKRSLYLSAYSYAVCEENATGNMIVTSPTCGSAGIIPGILYYEHKHNNKSMEQLLNGLIVAGLFGIIFKENTSIAGAVGGCQAEIGAASSMAAALLCSLNNLNIHQIEYAAEAAMEHFLGLTCDPVEGYVIVPCIERNAVAISHSYISYELAKHLGTCRKNGVSFDDVVKVMHITGESLSADYKETSKGGLAKVLKNYNC